MTEARNGTCGRGGGRGVGRGGGRGVGRGVGRGGGRGGGRGSGRGAGRGAGGGADQDVMQDARRGAVGGADRGARSSAGLVAGRGAGRGVGSGRSGRSNPSSFQSFSPDASRPSAQLTPASIPEFQSRGIPPSASLFGGGVQHANNSSVFFGPGVGPSSEAVAALSQPSGSLPPTYSRSEDRRRAPVRSPIFGVMPRNLSEPPHPVGQAEIQSGAGSAAASGLATVGSVFSSPRQSEREGPIFKEPTPPRRSNRTSPNSARVRGNSQARHEGESPSRLDNSQVQGQPLTQEEAVLRSYPEFMALEKRYNDSKKILEMVEVRLRSSNVALEDSQAKCKAQGKEIANLKSENLSLSLRVCPECKKSGRPSQGNKRRASAGRAAVDGNGSQKKAKTSKDKEPISNAIADVIRDIDRQEDFDGELMKAAAACLRPTCFKYCNNVVSQLSSHCLYSGETTEHLQHSWLPTPTSIYKGYGTPVFKRDPLSTASDTQTETSESTGFLGWSPKHPLYLASRPMMHGAAVATDVLTLDPNIDEDDHWKLHGVTFCQKGIEDAEVVSAATDEELSAKILRFASIIADQEGVDKHVKGGHSSRLTKVKYRLFFDFCKVLGFYNGTYFRDFFKSVLVETADKSEVLTILGVGGDPKGSGRPKTLADWKQRPTASLSKWRTMTDSNLKRVRELARKFMLSQKTPREASKAYEAAEDASKFIIQGKDIFFGTGELRQLYVSFAARSSVVVPDADIMDPHAPRKLRGDTSIITLARIDAYVGTSLSQLLAQVELNVSNDTTTHNTLARPLISQALTNILSACRAVFEESPAHVASLSAPDVPSTGQHAVNELRVPFRFSSLRTACDANSIEVDSIGRQDRGSEAYQNVSMFLDNQRAESDHLPNSSWHELDYYLSKRRLQTKHFYDNDDNRSYCVANPGFVEANICSWIGDVQDVFLGILEDDDALEFREMTEKDV